MKSFNPRATLTSLVGYGGTQLNKNMEEISMGERCALKDNRGESHQNPLHTWLSKSKSDWFTKDWPEGEVYTSNPSTQEAEAGRSLWVWGQPVLTQWVQRQPGSQKVQIKTNEQTKTKTKTGLLSEMQRNPGNWGSFFLSGCFPWCQGGLPYTVLSMWL